MDKFPIPEELQELFLDYEVGIRCRDECIKSVFKAKRAIKYGKDAEKAKAKFWVKVRELYPNMDGTIIYLKDEGAICLEKDVEAKRTNT